MSVHAFVSGSLGLYCAYVEAGEECERRRVDTIHAVAVLSPSPSPKGLSVFSNGGQSEAPPLSAHQAGMRVVGLGNETWHGTRSGYSGRGCRCDRCKAAGAAYTRLRAERRKAATAPKEAPVEVKEVKEPSTTPAWREEGHGTPRRYSQGCRCAECKAAKRLAMHSTSTSMNERVLRPPAAEPVWVVGEAQVTPEELRARLDDLARTEGPRAEDHRTWTRDEAKAFMSIDPDAQVRQALECQLGSAESVLRTANKNEVWQLREALRAILEREPIASRPGFEKVWAFLEQLSWDLYLLLLTFDAAGAYRAEDLWALYERRVQARPDLADLDFDGRAQAEG